MKLTYYCDKIYAMKTFFNRSVFDISLISSSSMINFNLISLDEALCEELLSAEYLALINPYQPNLSACWMFQRAMSVKIGSEPKPELIVGSSCHYPNDQYHYMDSTAI